MKNDCSGIRDYSQTLCPPWLNSVQIKISFKLSLWITTKPAGQPSYVLSSVNVCCKPQQSPRLTFEQKMLYHHHIICLWAACHSKMWRWKVVAFLYMLCGVKTSYFSREITQANHDFSHNTNKAFLCLNLTRALALHCDNREIQKSNQTKRKFQHKEMF